MPKFTGKERDAESGLDYFGARFYGSALGRFTSADWSPIQQPIPYANLRDPQTLNLYAYVGNNPLSAVDLDGHGWFDKFKNIFTDSMCFCEGDEADARANVNRARAAKLAANGYRPTTEAEKQELNAFVTSTIAFSVADVAVDSASGSGNAAEDADEAIEGTALTLINGRRPINYQFAGGTHPTGVPFSGAGFPTSALTQSRRYRSRDSPATSRRTPRWPTKQRAFQRRRKGILGIMSRTARQCS